MIQQIRSNKLLPAATTEKLFLNDTPSTTVPIVRADGLPSAATIAVIVAWSKTAIETFSPLSLFAQLESGAWYDPSDITTLFQDVDGTIPVANTSQPVRRMLDKSGRGNHITFSGTNPPTYQVDAAGAAYLQPVDGTSRGVAAGLSLSQPMTVLLATNLTKDGTNNCLYDTYTNSGGGAFILGVNTGSQNFIVGGTTTIATRALRGKSVFTAIFNGASSSVRFNRLSMVSGNAGSGGFVDGFSLFNLRGNPNPIAGSYHDVGRFYGLIVRAGALESTAIKNAETWLMGKMATPKNGVFIGDSTMAAFLNQLSVPDTITESVSAKMLMAVPNETIAQQRARWDAYDQKDLARYVAVQIGLNDMNYAEAASVAIARIQALITAIRADAPTVKIIISKMIPCKQRWIDLYGATNGLIAQQKWVDMNEAIAGNGPTPITGVDARVVDHVPLLDDGSGNLAAAYDTGDHIHDNNAGRAINAAAISAALTSLGLQ